jgi:hypothetical protein
MKMEYAAQILRGWPADGSLERAELIAAGSTLVNGDLVEVQPDGTVAKTSLTNTRKAGLVLRGNGDSSSAKNVTGIFQTPTPTLSVSAISAWVSPGFTTVTTTTAHNYDVGDFVTIAGVTTSAVNGNYVVESITDTTNFVILIATTPGAITLGSPTVYANKSIATNGGALTLWGNYIVKTTNYNTSATYVPGSGITASNGKYSLANTAASGALVPTAFAFSSTLYLPNTVQVTFGAPHGLSTGNTVVIAGVTSSIIPAGYNGTFTITVNGPTTFTYYLSGTTPGTVSVAGTATAAKDPEMGYVLRVQGTTATETAHLTIVVY